MPGELIAMPLRDAGSHVDRTSGHRRIDLDVVRGVAILLALGWHFNSRDSGVVVIDLLQEPGRLIGWAGVDLFFVLSGFLVGSLIFREYAKTGKFDAGRFLIRRAFKIWPVLYLYVGLVVLTGRYTWDQVVPQTLFHVQNYFPTPVAHLWSLAVEEHFYLAFAILFFWFLKRERRDIAVIRKFLVAVMVTAPILRIVGLSSDFSFQALQWQTQFRIDALACGVALALVRQFHPEIFQTWTSRKQILLVATVAGVLVLTGIRSHPALVSTLGYSIAYLSGAAFILLVYDFGALVERNPLARLLAWIGTYSHAMYVFQFVMFRAGEAAWLRLQPETPIPVLLDLAIRYLGAIFLAVVVTTCLEKPLLVLRDRVFPYRASA